MELPQNEDLSGILKGIKGASARAANKILGAAGKFWMDESYDHIVRSQEQYKHFIRYIEENPVKAGLSGDRYWLYQSSTGVSQGNTGIPACDSAQTGMSVLRSGETQAGMPVLPCAENNYGIHTLPNLETKFVAADSLIGLPKSGDALPMANVEQLKKELWDVRHKHFRARSYREKKELRKEDRKLRTELAKELRLGGGFDTASAKLMAEWDPYDQNASAPFSDPEWMFNVKDGFDVVIGNPPYIDSETMKKICPGLRDYLRVHLQATKGNWDMYIAFYEVGYSLLNNTGILSYISPNKWLSAPYGLALRSMLERHLCRLCDCSKVDVFEAGNTPLVAFLNKRLTDSTVVEGFLSGYILTRIGVVPSDVLNTKNWGVLLSPHVQMLARLKHQFSKLSDRFDVENPFATSEAYELRPLVQDASYKAAQFFKLINTGTISKFQSLWGLKQTAYLKGKYVQPVISKPAFGEIMPKRAAQSGRVKIITKGIRYFYCMLDSEGCYVAGKSTIIVMDRENNIDSLLQLLPVLNSKLVFFYIKESYSALGIDGGINFSSDMVEELPLPTPEQDSVLSRISKKIIKLKQEDPSVDTSALEAEIDQLVYDLYGLTEEEKAIVESASKKAKGKKSAKPSAKKKAVRGKKTQLPDSLPGWD